MTLFALYLLQAGISDIVNLRMLVVAKPLEMCYLYSLAGVCIRIGTAAEYMQNLTPLLAHPGIPEQHPIFK